MKFKKGDRVIVVKVEEGDAYYTYNLVGQEGIMARDEQDKGYTCVDVNIKGKEYNFLGSVELKLCMPTKSGTKFQVGDKVKQTQGGWNTAGEDNGKEAIVTEVGLNYTSDDNGIKIEFIGNWSWKDTGVKGEDAFELVRRDVTDNKGGESIMKKVIANNFELTEDALLVEKYLGDEMKDNFTTGLVVADHKSAILGEAKRLEEVEKDKEDR